MKSSNESEMTLIDVNDKTITFKIGIMNGRRFNQLMELEGKSTDVIGQINKMIDMVHTAPEAIKEFAKTNAEQAKLLPLIEKVASGEIDKKVFMQLANTGNQLETAKSIYENAVEVLKIMLIAKDEKEKDLLNSSHHNTFWQNQDVEFVIKQAQSFRSRALAVMYGD